MLTCKNLFRLLRVNQVICCIVIIVAFCVSSEITRNSDPEMKLPDEKTYFSSGIPSDNLHVAEKRQNVDELYKMNFAAVQKSRSASIFDPIKLLNNTDNYNYYYVRDKDLTTRSMTRDVKYFPFGVFFAAIAAAAATIVSVIVYHILIKIKVIQQDLHSASNLYGFLVCFWTPMTLVVLYVVIMYWSENYILSQYYRPMNWLVGSLGSVCLLMFLVLDLVFVFISIVLASFHEGTVRNITALEPLNKERSNVM